MLNTADAPECIWCSAPLPPPTAQQLESAQPNSAESLTGLLFAGSFLLFVAAPIIAFGFGMLATNTIPGCVVDEGGGAWGCSLLGVPLNWPVFWFSVGGFWGLVFGIPTFIVVSLFLAISAGIAERAAS